MNVKSRLVLIGLVLAACLYFVWPTIRFYQLDADREPLASKVRNGKASHGDSLALARWDSTNGESYRDAQEERIKLGLDLRGGIYITMEVDAPTLLVETAQSDAIDETFDAVMDATRKEAVLSDDAVIDVFVRNFDKIARPKGKTLLNYFDVGALGDDASDEAIITKLRRNIDDAVDQAMEVIGRRIDQFGVAEKSITKQGGRRIVVELPGVADETGVRSLLQTTARLEFKLVRNDANTAKFFGRIDKMLAGKLLPGDTLAKADTTLAKVDSAKIDSTSQKKTADNTDTAKKSTAGDTSSKNADSSKPPLAGDTTKKTKDSNNPYADLPEAEQAKAYKRDHPFTTLFLTRVQTDPKADQQDVAYISEELPAGEYYFYVPRKEIDKIKSILSRTDVRAAMPEDVVFAFSADAEFPSTDLNPESDLFALYAVTRETELTGEVITDAYPSFDQSGRTLVLMQMNSDGADRWAAITGKNLLKRIAIVLDSAVYSAPVVQSKIPNGSSQITGSKNAKEANLLSVVLKAGALKAPIRIIEERVVGPSLGQDSINKGVFSTVVATALVFLFMLFYYRYAGFVGDIGLLINIFMTIALLARFGATLTLPGIGGLVLTIGMAVDGNILIYERIREELAAGRPIAKAIQVGYDKAWSAVLDTHVTTLISGAILYFFGSGPVQGFAITLMIGLAASFFTTVFVTRTFFNMRVEGGADWINLGQNRPHEAKPAIATR